MYGLHNLKQSKLTHKKSKVSTQQSNQSENSLNGAYPVRQAIFREHNLNIMSERMLTSNLKS